MKFNKIIASAASLTVAAVAMTATASASLKVTENPAKGLTSASGMWMMKVFVPSEGIDAGIDCTKMGKVVFTFKPVDTDWFEGATGGAVVVSSGPAGVCPADHNWPQQNYWGVTDDENEIYSMDDASPLHTVALGDYTYQLECAIDDTNCVYQEVMDCTDGYVQIALSEWGTDMSEIEVVSLEIFDKDGASMIAYDGDGNVTTGSVDAEEAPAEDKEEAPAEDKEEAPAEVKEDAPAAGNTNAATDSSKGSPDTGVADVAVVAGLAIVAAGAVLVSKKSK